MSRLWRILDNLRFAGGSLYAHKLRSALTILGVVVGVATVIGMVSVIEGFNGTVKASFESFGATLVQFQKFDPNFGPGNNRTEDERQRENLTYEDAVALKALCPSMSAVSPERYWFGGDGGDGPPLVKLDALEATPDTLVGVTEDYPLANAKLVGDGRFVTASDVRRHNDVTVLGYGVARTLFPLSDPIGKRVTIGGRRYTVVGVMEEQSSSFFESTDAHVYLPITTFDSHFPSIKREQGVNIATIPRQVEWVDRVLDEGIAVLRARRGVPFDKPNDFGILTPDKLISNFRSITDKVTLAMVLVASIALLVGGVGIMNIMLVSVTERTREIGTRRAIGAVRGDILLQFLVEAMTLSGLGGALGVGVGAAIGAIARRVGNVPAVTPLWAVLIGLGVSITVGLIFGIYPATRASALEPAEALRYE